MRVGIEGEDTGRHQMLHSRKMMGSMRTKFDLDTAEDASALMEKENDIAKISNARDIFKTLDSNENQPRQSQNKEKHMRVEVKPDFLLEV